MKWPSLITKKRKNYALTKRKKFGRIDSCEKIVAETIVTIFINLSLNGGFGIRGSPQIAREAFYNDNLHSSAAYWDHFGPT